LLRAKISAMADTAFVTALVTVSVAVISAGAALPGQTVALRISRREANAARASALRAERKEAFVEFLDAAQQVEYLIERWWLVPQERDGNEAASLTHKMWFCHKKIMFLCSATVSRTAGAYAGRMNSYVWSGIPEDVREQEDYFDGVRQPFLDAAQEELGIRSTGT
jgi:hypothetical protein